MEIALFFVRRPPFSFSSIQRRALINYSSIAPLRASAQEIYTPPFFWTSVLYYQLLSRLIRRPFSSPPSGVSVGVGDITEILPTTQTTIQSPSQRKFFRPFSYGFLRIRFEGQRGVLVALGRDFGTFGRYGRLLFKKLPRALPSSFRTMCGRHCLGSHFSFRLVTFALSIFSPFPLTGEWP